MTGPVTGLFGEQPNTYPGSTKTRRAVSGESTDPWESLPHHEFLVKGVLTRFYGIGVLATMLQRKPQTIRKWENAGYLPAPRFRFPGASSVNNRREGQRRLYTREQIEGVVAIARRTGVLVAEGNRGADVGSSTFPADTHALFDLLRRQS